MLKKNEKTYPSRPAIPVAIDIQPIAFDDTLFVAIGPSNPQEIFLTAACSPREPSVSF